MQENTNFQNNEILDLTWACYLAFCQQRAVSELVSFNTMGDFFYFSSKQIVSSTFNNILIPFFLNHIDIDSLQHVISSYKGLPLCMIEYSQVTSTNKLKRFFKTYSARNRHPYYLGFRTLTDYQHEELPWIKNVSYRFATTESVVKDWVELQALRNDLTDSHTKEILFKLYLELLNRHLPFHYLVIYKNDKPIHASIVFIHKNMAYLGLAYTVPSARGKGIQMLSQKIRLQFAVEQRCEIATIIANIQSKKNILRNSFEITHSFFETTIDLSNFSIL